jgi:hypothetical protein
VYLYQSNHLANQQQVCLCKNAGPKFLLLSQISMFSLFFIQSLLYNTWVEFSSESSAKMLGQIFILLSQISMISLSHEKSQLGKITE